MNCSSSNEDDEMLFNWVKEEIQYLYENQHQEYFKWEEFDEEKNWESLIRVGFIQKLFTDVNKQISGQISQKEIELTLYQDQLEYKLDNYWNLLDQFLMKHSKQRLNLQFKQKSMSYKISNKSQMTFSKLTKSSIQAKYKQIESSIMHLVKILFYLLVQKHNNKQLINSQLENVQKSYNNQNIQDSQHDKQCTFLGRICQLPQEVQQYLVSIVQEIEENQIFQKLDPSLLQNHLTQQTFFDKITQKTRQTNQNTSSYSSLSNKQSPSRYNKRTIYKHIQTINQQNQQIKQKIQQIIQQNQKLQKQLQQNIQEQKKLVHQINSYNDEKQELFQYLKYEQDIDINTLEEFIEVIKHLEQQNQLLQNTISEIQQRNYELEKENAQKVHKLNKSAMEISKVNQQIGVFKQKIKHLKEDIQYLDQFVNNGDNKEDDQINPINAQLITSFDVEDQQEMMFNKSIDLDQRHSFGNVLRQNNDILNQKVVPFSGQKKLNDPNKLKRYSKILTDSVTGVNCIRKSFQPNEKNSKQRNMLLSVSINQQNQQNVQPFTQTQQQDDKNNMTLQSITSISHQSQIRIDQQDLSHQLMIEQQKQKYKNVLMKKLENLYKQISDLTSNITTIKQQNKKYQKKNKINEKKLQDLKNIHEMFITQLNTK